MKRILINLFVLSCLCLSLNIVHAQTPVYDLQLIVTRNDKTNGGFFDVKIQMRANGSSFKMGSGNLVIEYNLSGMSSPILQTVHNFSGGFYNALTVTEPVPGTGLVKANIELLILNNGTTVPTTWIDVVTIRFTIIVKEATSGMAWRTAQPNDTNVFDDSNPTPNKGTPDELIGLDTALPVELSSFSAAVAENNVLLSWATATETNNFGFDVERSIDNKVFNKIKFIEGHGTTVIPQSYRFADENLLPGTYYYRLKQIDFDGAFEYSKVVTITVAPPKEFTLAQNYPNPFNPETTINYQLPEVVSVKVSIYNLKGQLIRHLVDAQQAAGYHKSIWNGRNDFGQEVASGVYVYQITAGKFKESRKLTLVR